MPNTEWKTIDFDIDLVQKTLNHLEFLERISQLGFLDNEAQLKKTIYRYESIWLPFYSSNPNDCTYVPPVDIVWIWHAHMLAPIIYERDCMRICGRILDWNLMSMTEYEKLKIKTEQAWINYTKEPYNQDDNVQYENYETQISYNLLEASNRQKKFYHQVSLPHYKDRKYLQHGIVRYKKFLNLKRILPSEFVVPCFLIDLLWHTHQLSPILYKVNGLVLKANCRYYCAYCFLFRRQL